MKLKPRSIRLREESGVTLVELVVVAALVAILSGVLYAILNGIIRARDETEKIRDAETTAHYLFTRMTRELSSTSRTLTPLSQQKSTGSSLGGTGQGTTGPALYLEGINKKDDDLPHDSIRFVSSNAAQPFVDGPANYGTVEVQYSLKKASDEEALRAGMEANPADNGKTLVLVREEIPASVTNDDIRKKRRIVLPLANNVLALNFRYLKDGKWKEDWKDTNPPLPEAVEITLGLARTDGGIEYYRSALPLIPRTKPRTTAGSSSQGGRQ